jgi:hypothetical protein
MPAAWNADRRRSQAQADFWNPTGQFTSTFDAVLAGAGIDTVKSPPPMSAGELLRRTIRADGAGAENPVTPHDLQPSTNGTVVPRPLRREHQHRLRPRHPSRPLGSPAIATTAGGTPRHAQLRVATLLTSGNSPTYFGTSVHPKHPEKEVNTALDHADSRGLQVERTAAGHRWGRIVCSCGAWVSVWSTPRSPHNHGRQLRRWVDQHVHEADEENS